MPTPQNGQTHSSNSRRGGHIVQVSTCFGINSLNVQGFQMYSKIEREVGEGNSILFWVPCVFALTVLWQKHFIENSIQYALRFTFFCILQKPIRVIHFLVRYILRFQN